MKRLAPLARSYAVHTGMITGVLYQYETVDYDLSQVKQGRWKTETAILPFYDMIHPDGDPANGAVADALSLDEEDVEQLLPEEDRETVLTQAEALTELGEQILDPTAEPTPEDVTAGIETGRELTEYFLERDRELKHAL